MNATTDANVAATAKCILDEYYAFLNRYKIDARHYRVDFYILNDISRRYWRDVERLHYFHDMPRIDCYKIAGYTAYWICKLRPINIAGNAAYAVNPEALKFINEAFAVRYACGRVNSERKTNNGRNSIKIPKKLFQGLL